MIRLTSYYVKWSSLVWEITRVGNGNLNIDNNRAERAIKPFVIGRKNWLFSHISKGARASAVLYSIVETAKANGLTPLDYMMYLQEQNTDVEQLLPWRFAKNQVGLLDAYTLLRNNNTSCSLYLKDKDLANLTKTRNEQIQNAPQIQLSQRLVYSVTLPYALRLKINQHIGAFINTNQQQLFFWTIPNQQDRIPTSMHLLAWTLPLIQIEPHSNR